MREIIGQAVANYLAHGCMTHGAALAFYALFVLVPVPIFVVSGAAALVGDELARSELVEVLRSLVGNQVAVTLSQVLESADELASWRGARLFGLASVIFGSTTFFAELQETMNKIWQVPAASFRWWSLVRSRLVSFVMVAVSGLLLLALTLASALARGLGERLERLVPLPGITSGAAHLMVSLVVFSVLFGLVFRFVPDTELAFRDVWAGALGTALLFVCGTELIGLYLRQTELATAYGAAGSLVLTLTWIYYSALAFLFGAEFTRLLAGRRRVAGTG